MSAPLDIETLEILADIKADLRSRIARRRLRMELLDADTEVDDLI
jgi:phage tail sheath gpL-like